MIYGYARVSTKGQARDGNGLEAQIAVLREAGAEIIYTEAFTGTKRHRPELDKMLSVICPGDTIVVAKLDRIARNVRSGLDIIDGIVAKGCTLRILNMGVFDNSPMGKMARTMMLAFAEFERDMIVQRTQEGKAIARQNPEWREGAKPKEVPNFEEYRRRHQKGEITVGAACKALGISQSTWHRRCKDAC